MKVKSKSVKDSKNSKTKSEESFLNSTKPLTFGELLDFLGEDKSKAGKWQEMPNPTINTTTKNKKKS